MNKRAVTLVEMIIAVCVGAIILVAALNLMSNWIRSSVKGASHLSNMQAAVLIANYIENDLQRAVSIEETENSFKIVTCVDVKQQETVVYNTTDNGEGVQRIVDNAKERIIGDGFKLNKVDNEPVFKIVTFSENDNEKRIAVKLKFEIASMKNEEAYKLTKLIFCPNLKENAFFAGWAAHGAF